MSEDASLLKVGAKKWQERSQSASDQTTIHLSESRCWKLDALVLTHTDQDHGDMVEVAKQSVKKCMSVQAVSPIQFREEVKLL